MLEVLHVPSKKTNQKEVFNISELTVLHTHFHLKKEFAFICAEKENTII